MAAWLWTPHRALSRLNHVHFPKEKYKTIKANVGKKHVLFAENLLTSRHLSINQRPLSAVRSNCHIGLPFSDWRSFLTAVYCLCFHDGGISAFTRVACLCIYQSKKKAKRALTHLPAFKQEPRGRRCSQAVPLHVVGFLMLDTLIYILVGLSSTSKVFHKQYLMIS